MASASEETVAQVSSVSVMSNSVSVTKKIAKDNTKTEESEIASIFTGSEHPRSLIFLHNI